MLPLKIEYRYDSGDVEEAVRVTRSRGWKKVRSRFLLLTVAILLALALFFWLDPRNPVLYLLFGVYLGMMGVVQASWLRAKKMARGIWNLYPVLKYKFTTEIDSESIRTSCDIAFSMRRWECFVGYFESANLFHIQEGQRTVWIPKRAFAGESEINQMRELLKSKLSETAG